MYLNQLKLLFIVLFLSIIGQGQNCRHTNLSTQFDLLVQKKVTKTADHQSDSIYVKITIFEKSSETVKQIIRYSGDGLFGEEFTNCKDVRSYSTQINDKKEILDLNYGDLVIADLNFDGRDDFAITRDFGGNVGTIYNFYLQKEDGKFMKDQYLSNTLLRFPDVIDAKNETITVCTRANTYQVHEVKCKFNKTTKSWFLISDRLVP